MSDATKEEGWFTIHYYALKNASKPILFVSVMVPVQLSQTCRVGLIEKTFLKTSFKCAHLKKKIHNWRETDIKLKAQIKIVFFFYLKIIMQKSQAGVAALCFIHYLCTAVFSFSFENSRFQSVLCASPSAGLVVGGRSDVPSGERSPPWAPGLPVRHLNQTEPPASSEAAAQPLTPTSP